METELVCGHIHTQSKGTGDQPAMHTAPASPILTLTDGSGYVKVIFKMLARISNADCRVSEMSVILGRKPRCNVVSSE